MSKSHETDIYDGFDKESAVDSSSLNLVSVPTIENKLLNALYLQNNLLTILPEDFFPSLPYLKYLDLRSNRLTDLPLSIKNHPNLSYLLLQNNALTSLPDELGTLTNLKVVQLNGNPLMYPSRDIINSGTEKLLSYLNKKYLDGILSISSDIIEEASSCGDKNVFTGNRSFNSVIDQENFNKNKTMSVQFSERDVDTSGDEAYYEKTKGKCPKLPKSRFRTLPPHCQSAKYLQTLYAPRYSEQNDKIRRSFFKDEALKKHKDLLATREKILQGRKNLAMLKNWRSDYGQNKKSASGSYRIDANSFPYDTSPEYMTLLTREDIEKDLPDKYRKKLIRKCKPSVPRKANNDVQLALKIKKLFENLETMDLNRDSMTPRTEQKMLMNEIQKISEIKQRLLELSTTNARSVAVD